VAKKKKHRQAAEEARPAATPQAEYDPEKHCGFLRKNGSRCLRPKGWGVKDRTDGPCRRHGGAAAKANVRTGVYSKLKSDRLTNLIERVRAADHDVLDLTPEAELIRAITIDFLERYDEMREALILWHNTVGGTMQALAKATDAGDAKKVRKLLKRLDRCLNDRPVKVLDIADVSLLVDRIGRTVERIHKIRSNTSVTHEKLGAIFNSMTAVLVMHVDDKTKMQRILEGWKKIVVD